MKHQAKATLSAAGIAPGQDFESLTSDQLAAITAEAEKVYAAKYGKLMPSEFVRKRYGLLQQRAQS